MSPHSPAAIFDFDGTLTHRDSLSGFLLRVCGPIPLVRAVAANIELTVRAARDDGERDAAKARLFDLVLRDRDAAEVHEIGRAYAGRLVEQALRADVRARMEHHRSLGHELVIVSASLDVYLHDVARRLGVDQLACTRLEVAADGHLTGRWVGANCRGAEKVARLDAVIDRTARETWAYGDSNGDRELLASVDHPVWVGRKAAPEVSWRSLESSRLS